MPILSRSAYPVVGDDNYKKVLACNAAGTFTIALPTIWHTILGKTEVSGQSRTEVFHKFNEAEEHVLASSSSSRRIIIYDVEDKVTFSKGITVSVCADVFVETTITTADGKRRNYELAPFEERLKGPITNGAHDWQHNRHQHGRQVLDATPERLAFFNKLSDAMEAVTDMLKKLNDPETAARIAAGTESFQLLPSPADH